jgi:hypothetical protein
LRVWGLPEGALDLALKVREEVLAHRLVDGRGFEIKGLSFRLLCLGNRIDEVGIQG